MFIASSGISFGPYASINSASVSSGSVFFPCLAKLKTVMQPAKHGILVGHMIYLFQGSHLFGGLPGSKSSCQFGMLATVHIQRVDDLWQTQPKPQHQCQQWE